MSRAAAVLLAIVGVCLLALNVHGLARGVRHPDLLAFDRGEAATGRMREISFDRISNPSSYGIRMTREQALTAFEAARSIPDEEARVREIQRIVTESTVQFHPSADDGGTAFTIAPSENFLLWALAPLSPVIERLGFSSLTPYRFVDGAKVWECGAGLCGRLSSAFVHLAREAGIEAGKAALDDHIVAVARLSDGREFVVDPDLGFTLEGSLQQVSAQPERIVEAILADGHHARSKAERVAGKYGPQDNAVFWNGDRGFRRLAYGFERAAYLAKWAIPVMLVLAGAFIWSRASRPRTGLGDAGAGDAEAQKREPAWPRPGRPRGAKRPRPV